MTFGTHVHVHELGFSECPKAYVFRGTKDYSVGQVQVGKQGGGDGRWGVAVVWCGWWPGYALPSGLAELLAGGWVQQIVIGVKAAGYCILWSVRLFVCIS